MYHYLYKITNLVNGKFYYGIHSTNNLDDGYMGSGIYLHNAYKKYGIDKFRKEILEFRDSREEISKLEEDIVTSELVKNKNCYNIILGGENHPTLGKVIIYDKNNDKYELIDKSEYDSNKDRYHVYGKGLVSVYDNVEKKNKRIDKETYINNKDRYIPISKGMVTVIIDGKYMNISQEEYNKGGYNTIWSGKEHTEETKQKISNYHKLTNYQKGEKNSQFGTCWINNGKENKKIKKEEIDDYTNQGWKLGLICEKPIFSKLNYEDIKKDIKNGLKNKEICKKYNVGLSTLKKFIHDNNLTGRPYGKLSSYTIDDFIKNAIDNDCVIVKMSKQFGVDDKNLVNWCKRKGLPHKSKDIKEYINKLK